jgi:predicted TIM-barrel fold metal-dependent hydrolase
MIIDIFCHHISKSIGQRMAQSKLFAAGKTSPYYTPHEDPEVRLGLMEKYDIDIQAISQSAPVLLGFGAEDANDICRLSNNDNYALCKAYPDRFINICILSLLDVESAIEELNRSINELDCRGVTVASNQDGKGLDSPDYFPFYEKLVEHNLPLFIHPTHWGFYPLVDTDKGWFMMSVFGWPFDSTQAVWRLIFGGVIDRFPSLKIVMHHLGGMLPYFAGRIETILKRKLGEKLPRPISEYWGNIYGDTALDGNIQAYPCGYAFFGPDRMMFGTDYPFGPEEGEHFIRSNLTGVKSMSIHAGDMEKIMGGTAKKLLKIT